MKKTITLIALIILGFTSCHVEDIENTNITQNEPLENSNDNTPSIMVDEFISLNSGNYIDNLVETDFLVSINSIQLNPLESELLGVYSGLNTKCGTETKTIDSSPYLSYVDGVLINKNTRKTKSAGKSLKDTFGQNAKFHFKSLTKNGGQDTTIQIYVPKFVNITSPKVTDEKRFYPPCYYKNFILRWNADEQNKNGLIVSVEWTGIVLYGKEANGYIRKTDFIKNDNGEVVLNEKLFEGIPNYSLVYLTLLRGNIKNTIVGDYSYKLVGESRTILPFILIK